MISIHEIKAEDTYPIRKKELRENIDLPEKFRGDLDNSTFHLGLFENDILVSVVSFMRSDFESLKGNQYQLRGMATLKAYQKKGYGQKLVEEADKLLKKKNVNIVWCNARIVALDFYKKQGYKKIGEEFDIPQIGGHYVMYKNL